MSVFAQSPCTFSSVQQKLIGFTGNPKDPSGLVENIFTAVVASGVPVVDSLGRSATSPDYSGDTFEFATYSLDGNENKGFLEPFLLGMTKGQKLLISSTVSPLKAPGELEEGSWTPISVTVHEESKMILSGIQAPENVLQRFKAK